MLQSRGEDDKQDCQTIILPPSLFVCPKFYFGLSICVCPIPIIVRGTTTLLSHFFLRSHQFSLSSTPHATFDLG